MGTRQDRTILEHNLPGFRQGSYITYTCELHSPVGVAPGSIIVTDCWRAYNTLAQYHIDHYTVNHTQNFVEPLTQAHTNTVERKWRDVS